MKKLAIAIDGPAGSGKSTVAKHLASLLKIVYVDTGAMYRAVALYCIRKNIDTANEDGVVSILDEIKIDLNPIESGTRILLNKEDVTEKIRTQEIGKGASEVATYLSVRKELIKMQREYAKSISVVMDGRDIGTNVLKDADIKIYLSADVDERSTRRLNENEKNGIKSNFYDIRNQIILRDESDMKRKYNPLRKADDAIEINSTSMSIEDVVNEIVNLVNKQ